MSQDQRTPWLEFAWAAGILALGALALSSGWSGWVAPVSLAVTAVLTTCFVRLGALARLSVGGSALLGVLLLSGLVGVLVQGTPSAAGRPVWGVVLDAVPLLLTGPRPAPASAQLLAPGLLIVGLTGLFSGVRMMAGARHRVTPVAGAVLLVAAGLAVTGGTTDRWGLFTTLLLVLSTLGWAGLGQAHRRTLAPALGLALLVLPLSVAGAVLDRSNAFDPRSVVEPPLRPITVVNPLPQLEAWGKDPARELFRVRGTVHPLHLAVLTDYDGSSWGAPSGFRPLDVVSEASLPPGTSRSRVDIDVTLAAVPAPWLPAPGQPTTLSTKTGLVDAETGSVIDASAAAGAHYQVSGLVDTPDPAAALVWTVPDASVAGSYLAVPAVPEPLRRYAVSAGNGIGSPFARAKAIEAAVRGQRVSSTEEPGGSSYRRIEALLLGEAGGPGSQAGSSEQYASAFAVLARVSGLPTRIVVGFGPGVDDRGGTAGERVVRGADALAWPEVYFHDAGWVAFAPTPDLPTFGPPLTDQAPLASPAPTPTASVPPVQVQAPVTAPTSEVAPVPWWTVAGIALVLLVCALVGGAWVTRWRRRHQHRSAGSPGAWAELLDVAELAGLAVPGEEARVVARRLDGLTDTDAATEAPADRTERAGVVVRAAERTAYGPAGESPDVWEQVRAVSRSVRRRTPWHRRVLWPIDPRVGRSRGVVSSTPRTGRKIPEDLQWTDPPALQQDGHRGWAPSAAPERVED